MQYYCDHQGGYLIWGGGVVAASAPPPPATVTDISWRGWRLFADTPAIVWRERDPYVEPVIPPQPPPTAGEFKAGTGGIDPHELRIIKPTGLPPIRTKAVAERTAQAERDKRELSTQLKQSLDDDETEFKPIEKMSLQEIEQEIGVLLQKQLRTEEEDLLLLMLIAAAEL